MFDTIFENLRKVWFNDFFFYLKLKDFHYLKMMNDKQQNILLKNIYWKNVDNFLNGGTIIISSLDPYY